MATPNNRGSNNHTICNLCYRYVSGLLHIVDKWMVNNHEYLSSSIVLFLTGLIIGAVAMNLYFEVSV